MASSDDKGGGTTKFVGTIKIAGKPVRDYDVIEVTITSELDRPDSFAVTLGLSTEVTELLKDLKLTAPIEVRTGYHGDDGDDAAFIGEVTGVEPIHAPTGSDGGYTVVRGLNGLHALSRGKRSCAYSQLPGKQITDQDILLEVLKRYKSSFNPTPDYGEADHKKPPEIKYSHVYQHNQSDLEFVRHRAARIGYYVLVRRDKDTKKDKLLFQKRTATPSSVRLVLNAPRVGKGSDGEQTVAMTRFVPSLSTANQVTKVRVRCFNPKTRMELICEAPESGSGALLGGKAGKAAIEEKHPESALVRSDIPFESVDEGKAIAASILDERLLSYVTAEGTTPGDPRLKPGLVVKVSTNLNPNDKGKDEPYLITYVRHWYRSKGQEAYTTDFRCKRDATGKSSG